MANEELTRSQYLRALYEQRRLLNANSSVYVNPSVANQVDIQANNSQEGFDFSFANNIALREKEQELKELQESQNKTEEEKNETALGKIFGFVDEIAAKFGQGFVGAFEGILDLGALGLGAITGDDRFKDWAAINYAERAAEWTKNYGNFTIHGLVNSFEHLDDENYRRNFLAGVFGGPAAAAVQTLRPDTNLGAEYYGGAQDVLQSMGGVGNFVGGAAESIGFMIPSIMTGGAAAAANAPGWLAKGASLLSMGLSAAGKGGEEAVQEGATAGQALAYGAAKGTVEVVSEIVVGKALEGIAKATGLSKYLGTFGKINGVTYSKEIIKKAAAKELMTTMIEEGAEEVFSDLFAPLCEAIYKGNDAFKQYGDSNYYKQMALSFASGALIGGLTSGVQMISDYKTYGKAGVAYLQNNQEFQEAYREFQNNQSEANANKCKEILNNMYNQLLEMANDPSEAKHLQNLVEAFMGNNVTTEQGIESLKASLSEDVYQKLVNDVNSIFESTTGKSVSIVPESSLKQVDGAYPKAFISGDSIVINENYKTQLMELIKHEGVSHAILDLDTNLRSDLIKAIEKNTKLSAEFHKYDAELEQNYKKSELESERLAKFTEKVLNNYSSFEQALKQSYKSKRLLARLYTSLLDKIAKIKGIDKKYIKTIRTVLSELQGTQTSEQVQSEPQVAYAKDTLVGKYTVGSNKMIEQVKKTANGYDIYENGKLVKEGISATEAKELLDSWNAKKIVNQKPAKQETSERTKAFQKARETMKEVQNKAKGKKQSRKAETQTQLKPKIVYKVEPSQPVKIGKNIPVYQLTENGEILVKTVQKVSERNYIVKTRNKATNKVTNKSFDSYKKARESVLKEKNISNVLKDLNKAKNQAEKPAAKPKQSKAERKAEQRVKKAVQAQETIEKRAEPKDTWEGKYIAGDNKLAYKVVKTSTGYDIYEKGKLLKGYESITLDELQKFLTENKLRRQAYKQAEERRTKAQEDRAKKTVLGRWLINDGKDELKVNKYQGKYQVHNRNEIIGEYENADQVRAYMQEAHAEKYVNLQPKKLNDRFYISRNRTVYVKDGSDILSKVLAKSDNGFIVTTTNITGDGDVWTKEFASEKAAKNAIDTFTVKSYKKADVEKAIATQEQIIKEQNAVETKQEKRQGKKAKAKVETKVETKTEVKTETTQKGEKIISDVKRQSSVVLIEAGADTTKSTKVRIDSVKKAFKNAIKEVIPENAKFKIAFGNVKSSYAELNLAVPKDYHIAVDNMLEYLKETKVQLEGERNYVPLYTLLSHTQLEDAEKIMLETIQGNAVPTKLAEWAKTLKFTKIKGQENIKSVKLVSRIGRTVQRAMREYFGGPNTPTGEIEVYTKLIEGVSVPLTNNSLIALTTNINNYYNEENIGKKLAEFGIEQNTLINELSKNLEASIVKGKTLTAKQVIDANNILQLILEDVKELNRSSKKNNIEIARSNVVLAQALKVTAPNKIAGITLRNIDYSTRSPINIFENILGEEAPIVRHLRVESKLCSNNQIQVQTDWGTLLTETYVKEAGISNYKKVLNEKISANEEVTKDQAMALLSTIETVGIDKISKHGFVFKYKNGNYSPVYYPTAEDYENIKSALGNANTLREIIRDKFLNGVTSDYADAKMKEIAGIGLDKVEEPYFPSHRLGYKQPDLSKSSGSINPVNWGLGFLQSRTSSQQPFVIDTFTNTVSTYVQQLTQWGEWAKWYKQLKVMENTRVFGTTFTNEMRSKVGVQVYDKLMEFVHKTALGLPLDSKITWAGNIFDKVFGNLQQVAMLDLFTQIKTLGSMATLYQFFGTSVGLQGELQYIKNKAMFGDKRAYDVITKLSPTLMKRFKSNDAFSANLSKEVKGKVNKALSSVVRTLDMHIHVGKAWSMAQIKAQQDGFGLPWSEKNNAQAVKILERASDTTQPVTTKFNVGMYRAGANGPFIKRMFGMFASMGQNIYQGLYNVTVGWANGVQRVKALVEAEAYQDSRVEHYKQEIIKAQKAVDEATTEKEYKEAKKWLETSQYKVEEHTVSKETIHTQYETQRKIYTPKKWLDKSLGYLIGLIGSGIILTLIAKLKKKVYGKEEWEDWDIKQLSEEAVYQSFINWVPYIGTIANSIKNDTDLSVFTMSNINDTLDAFKNLVKAIKEGDGGHITGATLNALLMMSSYLGIPAQSMWKLVNGIWYNADHGSNIIGRNWLGMYSESYLRVQLKDAIEKKQTKKGIANLEVYLYNYSVPTSKEVLQEIYNLKQEDYSNRDVIPQAYMTSYEDEDGEKVELTAEQIKIFREFYNQADEEAQKLISSSSYKSLDNDRKAKLLKKLYSHYYAFAKYQVTKIEPSSRLGKLLVLTNGNVDLANYLIYLEDLGNIVATKTKTKKELAIKYINKISGKTKGEKLLLMLLAGYSIAENEKNKVIASIVKMGMSKKDAKEFIG